MLSVNGKCATQDASRRVCGASTYRVIIIGFGNFRMTDSK